MRPGLDDKVIAGWNALMISALARAAGPFREPDWLAAAERAARFLLEELTREGRLMRSWKDGRSHVKGVLSDHTLTVQAFVDLFEATGDTAWLEQALELAERTEALFWDPESGGFFHTGRDAEALVVRTQSLVGGAVPTGNGVAALAWHHLGTLTGRPELLARSEALLRAARPLLERAPRALGPELLAGGWRGSRGLEIAVGGEDSPAADALWEEVMRCWHPFRVLARQPGEASPLLPWMEGRRASPGEALAHVCQGWSCWAPVRTREDLRAQLAEV